VRYIFTKQPFCDSGMYFFLARFKVHDFFSKPMSQVFQQKVKLLLLFFLFVMSDLSYRLQNELVK
jgi:hypothetical protein